MCLIILGWKVHPQYPLVVAANRDEFLNRPTAAAAFWEDAPQVLAGRDLQAGGTWMGITKAGRFAALTNYRDPAHMQPNERSRGRLVSDYLVSNQSPEGYIESIYRDSEKYNGFNLLVADRQELVWFSNVNGQSETLKPGIYGISNHLLDTPWPKLEEAKTLFAQAIKQLPEQSKLFELLFNDQIHPDEILPQTGVSIDRERALSAIFVTTFPGYGTRNSTVITENLQGEIQFTEQTWGEHAKALEKKTFKFNLEI